MKRIPLEFAILAVAAVVTVAVTLPAHAQSPAEGSRQARTRQVPRHDIRLQ